MLARFQEKKAKSCGSIEIFNSHFLYSIEVKQESCAIAKMTARCALYK